MRFVAVTVLSTVLLVYVVGCITLGSSISASSVPLGNRSYTELGTTSGSVSSAVVLGIPFGGGDTRDAHWDALKAKNADGLVSVTVDNTIIFIPFVTVYKTKVQGTAIKFTD